MKRILVEVETPLPKVTGKASASIFEVVSLGSDEMTHPTLGWLDSDKFSKNEDSGPRLGAGWPAYRLFVPAGSYAPMALFAVKTPSQGS